MVSGNTEGIGLLTTNLVTIFLAILLGNASQSVFMTRTKLIHLEE